jgi:glycosyltransferase involved in cell wall biosynthesis
MLAPEFYPVWGGVGTYIIELVRHLPSSVEIFVLTPRRSSFDGKMGLSKSDFSNFFGSNIHIKYVSEANDTFTYNATFQAACLKYVPEIVKQERIDLIHSHTAQMPDLLLMFRHLKKPVVTTAHTTIKSQRLGTRNSRVGFRDLEKSEKVTYLAYPFLRIAETLYLKQKRSFIAPSYWMKQWLINDHQIKNSIKVIPNSVDVHDYEKTDKHNTQFDQFGRRIVLYVGRLLAMKGIDSLIDALPRIIERFGKKELLFIFAGPGDQTRYLEQIKRLDLTSCVLFTGPLSRESTRDLMHAAEILVAPSVLENSPYTILEAMACKKPVVATAVGGIPEIIQTGYNGVLVQSNSSKHLSDSIINLLDAENFRKSIAHEAQQTISRKFSWAVNIDKYCKYYSEVLSSE